MKVTLIDYTRDALALLLYTKNTRLKGEQTLDDIRHWPEAKKAEHLAYMKDTIKSSWEFVNYTFEISGVTRAFTHQLVRTRNGRYAQESMRTVDVGLREIKKPETAAARASEDWDDFAGEALHAYHYLIGNGMPVQDARGILPTNVTTSIIAQFSLRTLHEMAMVRLCTRTQGEYQNVFKAMKAEVFKVHPWTDDFIQVACVQTGVCVFPRYTECPVQKHALNGGTVKGPYKEALKIIKSEWEKTEHEAEPIAKDGRTM